jgi:hypothetical protein
MISSNTLFKHSALAAAVLTLTALAACGGGGGSDSTSTSSSGTTTASAASYSGTISGLGSIVVNGVRFSTTGADTVDADDPSQPYTKAFALGTTVTVKGTVDASGTTGTATSIEVHGGVRGLVTSVGSNTFTVAGEVINVDSNTVYEGSTTGFGFASLVGGTSYVEVFGVLDTATGTLLATRVEEKTSAVVAAEGFAIKGQIATVDTTAHTFDLTLRTGVVAHVTYVDANVKPDATSLVAGAGVRILLSSADATALSTATTGTVNVTATKVLVQRDKQVDGTPTKLQGAITTISTDGKTWTIGDVTIDVSQSPTLEDIDLSTVTVGTVVKVKGTFASGVLVATEVESDNHERAQTGGGVKLFGAVTASDSTAHTFVVQGVTVTIDTTATTPLTQPAVGTYVEVVAKPVGTPAVLTAVSINTPSTTASTRPFEVYGTTSCTAGQTDLSGTFTLALRGGSVSVDGSAATVTTGRNVSLTASSTALQCLVEVKGTVTTVNSVKTITAKAIEVIKRAATVSLR